MAMPSCLYAGGADPIFMEAKLASGRISDARFFAIPELAHLPAFATSSSVFLPSWRFSTMFTEAMPSMLSEPLVPPTAISALAVWCKSCRHNTDAARSGVCRMSTPALWGHQVADHVWRCAQPLYCARSQASPWHQPLSGSRVWFYYDRWQRWSSPRI